MPKIRYLVAGLEAVEEVHPDLLPFYEDRPGYTIVVDELAAAVLKGNDLDQAARELAGVTDPGHTPAAEKRELIVEATAPTGDGLPATIVPGADGVPILTPDPEPAPEPERTTKRRTAATDKES